MQNRTEPLELAEHPLPYLADASVYFAPLAHLPGAIWLDSGKQQNLTGIDLLSAKPYQTWTQWADYAEFNSQHLDCRQRLACRAEQALQILQQQQRIFYGAVTASNAPGLMGFCSYTLGLATHGLTAKHDDIIFPQAEVGFYTWHIQVDHFQQRACLQYYPRYHQLDELLLLLNSPVLPAQPLQVQKPFVSNLSATAYQQAFNTIQQHLQAGDCYQVNFAQRFTADAHGSGWASYQQLRLLHPNPYSAYLRSGFGEILCLSPEEFIHIDSHGHIRTRPIKGTQPRHVDAQQDQQLAEQLRNSAKNRAENIMIVDLLRNDLGQVCTTGSVTTAALCQLHSFATVHHLISEIHGQLRDNVSALHAFSACFPGGSITGAPKRQAMHIIDRLEPHQRHIFCGSLFALTADQQLRSNICIRTLLFQSNDQLPAQPQDKQKATDGAQLDTAPNAAGKLYCWAGGGIVAESHCNDEYAEADWKVGQLLADLSRLQ